MQTTRERLVGLCFDEEKPLNSVDMQGIIQCWIEENDRVFQLHCQKLFMLENWEFLYTIYQHKLHGIDTSIATALRTYLLDFLESGEIQQPPICCQQPDFQLFLDNIADKTLNDIFHTFFIETPQYLNITDKNNIGIVDDAKCNTAFKTGNKILQMAVLLDVRQQLEKLLCANVKFERFMVQGQTYINPIEKSSLTSHSLFPVPAPASTTVDHSDSACCCTLF